MLETTNPNPVASPSGDIPGVGEPQNAEALTQGLSQDLFGGDDIYNEMQSSLGTEYATQLGGNTMVDPATIAMIIEIVMMLLKKCQEARAAKNAAATPQQYIADAQNPSRLTRLAVKMHVTDELRNRFGGFFAYRRNNGDAIVETILNSGKKAKPVQVEKLLNFASF